MEIDEHLKYTLYVSSVPSLRPIYPQRYPPRSRLHVSLTLHVSQPPV